MATVQKNLNSEFQVKKESNTENKTRVEQLLSDLERASVNHQNFDKWMQKFDGADQMIGARIEDGLSEYGQARDEYKDLRNSQTVKSHIEDHGTVPKEVHDLMGRLHMAARVIIYWSSYQAQLQQTMLEKFRQALSDTKALDIERDALQYMREMEDKRAELQRSIMQSMGDKFASSISNVNDKYVAEMKEVTNSMSTVIYHVADTMSKALQSVSNNISRHEYREMDAEIQNNKNIALNEIRKPQKSQSDEKFDDFEDDFEEPTDSSEKEESPQPAEDDISASFDEDTPQSDENLDEEEDRF